MRLRRSSLQQVLVSACSSRSTAPSEASTGGSSREASCGGWVRRSCRSSRQQVRLQRLLQPFHRNAERSEYRGSSREASCGGGTPPRTQSHDGHVVSKSRCGAGTPPRNSNPIPSNPVTINPKLRQEIRRHTSSALARARAHIVVAAGLVKAAAPERGGACVFCDAARKGGARCETGVEPVEDRDRAAHGALGERRATA